MADTNELVERLSAAVGIIMEDIGPAALRSMPIPDNDLDMRLRDLQRACDDARALTQAAQILARRGIR